MSIPVMGHELAEIQPVPIPILRHFEWSSENSPQAGVSDVLTSQLGGRRPSTPLKKDPFLLKAFAPSADLMHAHFESLVLATMTTPTKSPVSPLMEPAPTARDRYVSLSSNAIGAYLTVARFWIPPSTDSAGGVWSHPVVTVIGAPTPTVDGVSLDGQKAFPGARTLDPGSSLPVLIVPAGCGAC